ncbi:MAG: hypothetical protein M0P59_08785 [Gallionella sp.]|jgi:hypothetical protein|nr:hypothetical protein [Gallionella sp.]MCK9354245.1 hypothetical protein [Gallionella sp.]
MQRESRAIPPSPPNKIRPLRAFFIWLKGSVDEPFGFDNTPLHARWCGMYLLQMQRKSQSPSSRRLKRVFVKGAFFEYFARQILAMAFRIDS